MTNAIMCELTNEELLAIDGGSVFKYIGGGLAVVGGAAMIIGAGVGCYVTGGLAAPAAAKLAAEGALFVIGGTITLVS